MRKIVQMFFEVRGDEETTWSELHALCDDLTVWYYRNDKWNQWIVPEIPQDDEGEIAE